MVDGSRDLETARAFHLTLCMLKNLINQYSQYEGSENFINCAFSALSFRKEKDIKNFITSFFLNNKIENCSHETVKRLAAHYNNVAFDKLNLKDYQNYMYSLFTVANLRMIAKEMEVENG